MNKLSFEDFVDKLMGGESRHRPGVAVGYIMLDDFYAEWAYANIETDDDGEVTPAGWAETEKQDGLHSKAAYQSYVNNDTEYIA